MYFIGLEEPLEGCEMVDSAGIFFVDDEIFLERDFLCMKAVYIQKDVKNRQWNN